MIDQLHELHICISYNRVLKLENGITHSMCQQFQDYSIVCFPHLRKELFVAGALDNIDHKVSNTGSCREPLMLDKGDTVK